MNFGIPVKRSLITKDIIYQSKLKMSRKLPKNIFLFKLYPLSVIFTLPSLYNTTTFYWRVVHLVVV